MPFYGGTPGSNVFQGPYNPPTLGLYPGDLPVTLINPNDGTALAGKAGQSVALAPPPGLVEQVTVSVSGFFSGAPGAFEIDWQTADVDADGNYVAETATITVVNANNAFHAAIPVKGKFGRPFVKTLTNAVSLTLVVEL